MIQRPLTASVQDSLGPDDLYGGAKQSLAWYVSNTR
jgi:hypothetical protein